eukprot:CAMPEP_0173185372 /NCGR_PEP_ID=MMETSP1141-20130122/9518_1 /TAXON_ID=483371 /ORGANISM="non described non described, Strain CCMP2298" /LENGTH=42 /DNA_ID= /DNA_START= /DNA_END= /DNA_ORIENTATION=
MPMVSWLELSAHWGCTATRRTAPPLSISPPSTSLRPPSSPRW